MASACANLCQQNSCSLGLSLSLWRFGLIPCFLNHHILERACVVLCVRGTFKEELNSYGLGSSFYKSVRHQLHRIKFYHTSFGVFVPFKQARLSSKSALYLTYRTSRDSLISSGFPLQSLYIEIKSILSKTYIHTHTHYRYHYYTHPPKTPVTTPSQPLIPYRAKQPLMPPTTRSPSNYPQHHL